MSVRLPALSALFALLTPLLTAEEPSGKYSSLATLVAQTHVRSLETRKKQRLAIIARKPWPGGPWGDTLWALAALYQGEKTAEANSILLKNAKTFTDASATTEGATFLPEDLPKQSPWAYFALPDYVRILCLFRKDSPHFPGRLTAETEAAMKAALWLWAKSESRAADATPENLLVLHGTENHDLTLRPNYYLIASVLKDDPAYATLKYDDGKTPAEHFAAYNSFFRKWAAERAKYGLWVEIGADTYQKYSYPALFNLADLPPDPIIKKQFHMLLDLAFIEEAQISVHGRRGGGRSRAGYGKNSFEAYKNLLYAPEGKPAGSSHSSVIETGAYQLPAAAIALRNIEFPAKEPFVISNRVLGELEEGEGHRLAADSALVNYAWRTPSLLLGSTLQNPALAFPDGTLRYSGISRQDRWCGVIFQNENFSAIYPELQKLPGGRAQHPFWSFQHENVLLIQRILPDRNKLGSYNTGWIGIRVSGKDMEMAERDGWIFVEKGHGYAAVRFLDSDYNWDDTGRLAIPKAHDMKTSASRIAMITGDLETHGDFGKFQETILATPITVSPEAVTIRGGIAGADIRFPSYDPRQPAAFTLPETNGKPLDLRTANTFLSPYLRGKFGSPRISVKVGPIRQTYDFAKSVIE
jgi:hypothetical protein